MSEEHVGTGYQNGPVPVPELQDLGQDARSRYIYQRPKRRVIHERLLEWASLVLTQDGLRNTSRNERFLKYVSSTYKQ